MQNMKFTVVAVSAPALAGITGFQKEWRKEHPDKELVIRSFYVADAGMGQGVDAEKIRDAIQDADVAIIDIMGASQHLQEVVRDGLLRCKGQRIVIGNANRDLNRLGAFAMDSMKMMAGKKPASTAASKPVSDKKNTAGQMMHMMRRMAIMMGSVVPVGMMKDMKNLFLLIDYWQQASREDIYSFMHLILRNYCGMRNLPREKPCTMRYGIYLKNPETGVCCDTCKGYWKKYSFLKERPTVALLFYGHCYPNDFYPVVKSMMKQLEKDCNVLPVAFSQNEDKDLARLEQYLTETEYPVKAIVNLMPFRLGAGPMGGDADGAVEILKKVNVPYFKPFCLTKVDRKSWEQEEGVNAGEFLISIMLPELDGGIHTYPVGIVTADEKEESTYIELTHIEPIEERIQTFCDRVRGYLSLQQKRNAEKKLAVICYNYPPGEDNLFGGAFLDTFASVSVLLKTLQKAGYQVSPMSQERLQSAFGEGACNEPEWHDKKQVENTNPYGLINGSIFIGLQPCRSSMKENDISAYHNRNGMPDEKYAAFYRWVREDFGADAILHIGTHGTLEFLPGKDSGMTENCLPDRIIGTTPHFYYYYMGNPSEAMVAKRRSHAVLISYAPPVFRESGLSAEYSELKAVIAEYRESLKMAPERSGDLLDAVGKAAAEAHLLTGEAITAGKLEQIEELLYEYETSLIPDGLHIMDETESRGILKALDGEYLPAAPGGDILKNPDMLPAGRNLVQFDPRLVPTKTAFERGGEIAKKTLKRYYEQNGCYPESAAVILWGLETSKTQGETIGQILYYLGIRMKQYEGSFDSRFEIIPTQEMDRPRVDTVIHICGFFRNMYPNLINDFNELFRKLEELQETDEQSSFAEHTRQYYRQLAEQGYEEAEAKELARSRIFGPKAGEYGTSLTETVRKGTWADEEELGACFTDSLSYVYSTSKHGQKIENLLQSNYKQVSMMSQVRNNVEYELIDLDHYYEFYGGLAKAVEKVQGKQTTMYVADTVGEQIRLYDAKASIEKGIRTRLLNPAWIEGMMKHDYHGVSQIAKRFENVIGLTASTSQIDSETFSELEACYVGNAELRSRMQESNRWAYLNLLKRLAEAKNRGYWQADDEELEELQNAYLETEGQIE